MNYANQHPSLATKAFNSCFGLASTVGSLLQLHRLRQNPGLRPGRVEPHAP